ncbi:iron ABC transporter permease [uncultured Bacteroides sp.]|uniref:FecCD family ABC transporter permease n=1 Tax=uncultured Bacteroides sp. TaxID=162156 RepID=UPI002AAB0017|nr:iron ABC transporter permease [uncultured Bacteroides sp.]
MIINWRRSIHVWNLKQSYNINGVAILSALTLLLVLIILFSFSVGRYSIAIGDILKYLFTGEYTDANLPLLLNQIRLPRILAAVLVGGSLSVSGASYQGIFRNPMVSPDILGVSSGAGFGASLAILFSWGLAGIQGMAFVTGIISVCIALSFSKIMSKSHDRILMLVLSGMIVGSMFTALISLIKYLADSEYKLPDITFWLMGSLAEVTMKELKSVFPFIGLALLPLILSSWRLNILSFGDEEARALGVHAGRLRIIVIACASLITASVVSITGLIGWVGLIIPHFARFLVGPDHKVLLPASFLIGAIFMLIVDGFSRSLSSLEIPLGIITSLIGAPMFLILLRLSSKHTW